MSINPNSQAYTIQHGMSSGCGWRRWPPDVEGSCIYTQKVIMDSQQGVVLQLGGWTRGQQLLIIKSQLVTKCYMASESTGSCELGLGSIKGGEFLD